MGCATTGTWDDRRSSVEGNATVVPQYKIFLNDPDINSFPNGIIGEMISATVLPHVCDTAITFAATVSKAGNIEVLIDVPPLNPNGFGPEDVQLGYNVEAGYNELLPAWDAKKRLWSSACKWNCRASARKIPQWAHKHSSI